jgi:hypothetical protein
MSSQLHAPGIHRVRGWMGLGAGVNDPEQIKQIRGVNSFNALPTCKETGRYVHSILLEFRIIVAIR